MPTSTKNTIDKDLNPGNDYAEKLTARETASLDQIESGLRPDGFDLGFNEELAGEKSLPSASFDSSEVKGNPSKTGKKATWRGFLTNRKTLAGVGVGGLGGVIIAIMMFFPALKLDSVISSLTGKLGGVSEYAINERFEYLTTRWIAMRVMQTAYPGDTNLVFCQGGGILCSLGSTKYSSWFQDQLDIKFEKQGMRVTTTLNATGRSGLGGKATSFTLDLNQRSDLGQVTTLISKEMSHTDARRYVKNLAKKVHGRNYLLRFVSKQMLMRKYGIKYFNVLPDKTAKNINELRANMKASIIKATLGKISARSAAYISCLSGSNALGCQEALSKLSSSIDSDIDKARQAVEGSAEGSPEREQAQRELDRAHGRQESLATAKSVISGEADSTMSKMISKQILTKVAGPVAVAGVLDLAFKVVGAVDNRVLEAIMYDRQSQIYMSFAYNEEASPVVIRDQMRNGTVSPEHIEVATGMYDGIEQSLLFQAVNGLLEEGGQYSTVCQTDNGEELVTLEQGELLCPETRLVRDYTSLKQESWWTGLSSVAGVWNGSIGIVFDVVGDVVGAVLGPLLSAAKELPGIKNVAEFTSAKLGELVELMLGELFGSVALGVDAPGKNNYDATGAAMHETFNMGMSYGQDPDNPAGTVLGAGGAVITDQQLGILTQEIQNQRKEQFESKTMMAKIFDTSDNLSMASQLIAALPVGKISLINTILSTPASIVKSLTQTASASTPTVDAMILGSFGTPVYGYPVGDPVLKADPGTYTAEFCEASSAAREESFSLEDDELIASYKKTDPCALDKVIGGMLATAVNDTESDLYIEEPGSSNTSSVSDASNGSIDNLPPAVGKMVSPIPENAPPISMTARYGRYPKGDPHWGVDLSGGGDNGWEFVSVCDGTVDSISYGLKPNSNAYKGASPRTNYVWIKCDNGIYMGYGHFYQSKLRSYIKPGYRISAGTPIAYQGNQGHSTGPHLHFQINPKSPSGYSASATIDPAAYLARNGVQLPKANY